MGWGENGGRMMEPSTLPVTESLGKWIVVNLQLGDLGVLIGSDCHKFCIWDRDGNHWLTS